MYAPSRCALATELSPVERPLALRPRLAPGLPFSVDLLDWDRPVARLCAIDCRFWTIIRHIALGWDKARGAAVDKHPMALEPTVEERELLADTFARAGLAHELARALAETAAGAGLLAATAGLWLVPAASRLCRRCPPPSAWWCWSLATMVRFETPFGFTAPVQLAFVPLLFALPMALVPVAVALALTVARLPGCAQGPGLADQAPAHPRQRLVRRRTLPGLRRGRSLARPRRARDSCARPIGPVRASTSSSCPFA